MPRNRVRPGGDPQLVSGPVELAPLQAVARRIYRLPSVPDNIFLDQVILVEGVAGETTVRLPRARVEDPLVAGDVCATQLVVPAAALRQRNDFDRGGQHTEKATGSLVLRMGGPSHALFEECRVQPSMPGR